MCFRNCWYGAIFECHANKIRSSKQVKLCHVSSWIARKNNCPEVKVCPRIRISTKQFSFWFRKLRFKNYNLWKRSVQPGLQGQTQVDTEKPLKKAEMWKAGNLEHRKCGNPDYLEVGKSEINQKPKPSKKKKQRSLLPCFRASSWRLNQSRSKVAPKPKFPASLGGKNGWAVPNWNRRS